MMYQQARACRKSSMGRYCGTSRQYPWLQVVICIHSSHLVVHDVRIAHQQSPSPVNHPQNHHKISKITLNTQCISYFLSQLLVFHSLLHFPPTKLPPQHLHKDHPTSSSTTWSRPPRSTPVTHRSHRYPNNPGARATGTVTLV
jgi:hypothetical protein